MSWNGRGSVGIRDKPCPLSSTPRRVSVAPRVHLAKLCRSSDVRGLGTNDCGGKHSGLRSRWPSRSKHLLASCRPPAARPHSQSALPPWTRRLDPETGPAGWIGRMGHMQAAPKQRSRAAGGNAGHSDWGNCVAFSDYSESRGHSSEPFGSPCAHPVASHRARSLRAAGSCRAIVSPLCFGRCCRWLSSPRFCCHRA